MNNEPKYVVYWEGKSVFDGNSERIYPNQAHKFFDSLVEARKFACSKCKLHRFIGNQYFPEYYITIAKQGKIIEKIGRYKNYNAGIGIVYDGYYMRTPKSDYPKTLTKISPSTGRIIEKKMIVKRK